MNKFVSFCKLNCLDSNLDIDELMFFIDHLASQWFRWVTRPNRAHLYSILAESKVPAIRNIFRHSQSPDGKSLGILSNLDFQFDPHGGGSPEGSVQHGHQGGR